MEHFEETALDTADHKLAKWLRFIDDTSMIWPHGPARMQQFVHRLNSVRPTVKFTMEVEASDILPFLDVLVMKRGTKLVMKVYWKTTHTGRYLHLNSNHPYDVKRRVVHNLIS
jgi:hypothetical protein